MMDHNLQNVSDAEYKRLIAEAYPSPKRDIHAAVMAQVTAEAAQSRKKAKILTPAFRNRFVKYGSIAACFVLLVTLGFRVLPMMTKDAVMETENAMFTADMAYTDGAAPESPMEETSAETQAAAGGTKNGAPFLYKAVLTDSTTTDAAPEEAEDEIIEEPAAAAAYSAAIEAEEVMDDVDSAEVPEPEAPMVMMAPAPTAEDAIVEEAVAEEAPAEDLIEEEVVEECVVEEAVEECVVEEAAPQSGITSFESELKLALTREIDAETYTAWMTGHGYTSPENWSIAEFVQNFGISRERFTELYDALTSFFEQTSPDAEIISYNLDELYRQ
ncbi:MAG: hypothetical protein J6I42_09990 [Clostridia bacterium]|nr:hypothetical protein [Clostridia bacterium]